MGHWVPGCISPYLCRLSQDTVRWDEGHAVTSMCRLRLLRCSLYEGLGTSQGGNGAIGAIFGRLLECFWIVHHLPVSSPLGLGARFLLQTRLVLFFEGSEVFSTIATFDHSTDLFGSFANSWCLWLR